MEKYFFKYMFKLVHACLRSPKVVPNPVLITIGYSHYCEKVRWILDISPMKHHYAEDMHCPVTHVATTLSLHDIRRFEIPFIKTDYSDYYQKSLVLRNINEKNMKRKEKYAVPKLLIPLKWLNKYHLPIHDANNSFNESSKRTIAQLIEMNNSSSIMISHGSSGIIQFLCHLYPKELGHLYPDHLIKQIIDLEVMLESEFATATTNWAFGNMLLSNESYSKNNNKNRNCNKKGVESSRKLFIDSLLESEKTIPWIERFIWRFFGTSILIPRMIEANQINDMKCIESLDVIRNVFEKMDQLLIQVEEMKKLNNLSTNNYNTSTTTTDSSIDNKYINKDLEYYILGTDVPTIVDYSFAAFAIPVLLPNETKKYFPNYNNNDQSFETNNNNNCSNTTSYSSNNVHDVNNIGFNNMKVIANEMKCKYRSAQYVLDFYKQHRLN